MGEKYLILMCRIPHFNERLPNSKLAACGVVAWSCRRHHLHHFAKIRGENERKQENRERRGYYWSICIKNSVYIFMECRTFLCIHNFKIDMQNNGKSCGGTVIKNSVFAFLPGGNRGGGSSFFLVLTQILVLVVVGFSFEIRTKKEFMPCKQKASD